MRRSISNKCKKLLHMDTSPSPSPPAEHSFRCAAHEKYKPKVDAPQQSPPVTPATTVEPDKVEDEEENANEEDDEEEKEDDEEEEEQGEKDDKNRWRHGKFTEIPKRPDSPSPLEAFTQDGPIVYEGEGWEALSQLQSPPPPLPLAPSSAPSQLQRPGNARRPGNAHRWTASPSTFDTTSAVLVLRTLDGCSIPVNNRFLPLYANVLNSAGTSTCRCGGDAYVAVAALLRAWPDFARRAWGSVRTRAVYERDEAVASWLEPARDKLRELLGDRGEIDRSVSDAVQEALRRKAQQLTGVGGATVDQWAREDMQTVDWLEGRSSPESPLGFIRNAFANMNF